MGGPSGRRTSEDEVLDSLFRQSYAPFVRMAALMMGSVEEAEEIVMDAFLGLARRPELVRNLDEPAAYVRTSVVNGVRSRHRRLRRVRAVAVDRPASGQDPVIDELWDRLSALSDDQRRCLVLRFYEDLSEQDTALVMGCSVGTVKSLSSRGLRTLRLQWVEADAVADQEVRYA